MKILLFLKSVIQRLRFYTKAYRRLEIMAQSAALSYFTVISFFPLFLVMTSILGQVIPGEYLQKLVSEFFHNIFPYSSELVERNLMSLFSKKAKFGVVGAVSLVIAAQLLFVNLERMVNRLLHSKVIRPQAKTRLMFVMWLFAVLAMLLAPVVIETFLHLLTLQNVVDVTPWLPAVGTSGFLVTSFLFFLFVGYVLPTQRLSLKQVAVFALIFAGSLQIGKMGYRSIVAVNMDRYNLIYGSLSSLILMSLWIFYFYNVLLFVVYLMGRRFGRVID